MTHELDVFIERCSAAVIPTKDPSEFDPITGAGPVANSYLKQNSGVLEQEKSKPRDYSVNVFSTANDTFYTQYQNNMITPITYRSRLDQASIHEYIDTGNDKGVFIVERYTLSGVSKTDVAEFLMYYQNTKGLSYSDAVTDSIKDLIDSRETSRRAFSNTEVRILTFIPYDLLKANQFTYVTGPGVVIVHGDVPDKLLHPYSPMYLEDTLLQPTSDTGSVAIDISIIDTCNKPYYYMLGNSIKTIRPIYSTTGSVLPTGCTIVNKRGKSIVDEEYFSLEEFEANGFYRSKDLCETNGNKSLLVEEAKYKIDLEKITLEVSKLREANSKLILEHRSREEQHRLDLEKKATELSYYTANKQVDLAHTAGKVKIDMLTKRVDVAGTIFKTNVDIVKSQMELNKLRETQAIKNSDNMLKLSDLLLRLFK